jgi:hypothetical protein
VASDGTLGGGAAGGKGRLNAVEQRALLWEELAQRCIRQCRLAAGGSQQGKAGTPAAAATASGGLGGEVGDQLAAAVPFVVDADAVEVQASQLLVSYLRSAIWLWFH